MLDAFFDAHGGVDAVAAALKVPVGTVRVWKTRKAIPRARWPEVLEHFPDVTMAKLKELEAEVAQ